ncbi:hypothetical protein QNH10_16460 [Sporosarcina thermotolerans]|uniref:hypothetical protein n=1 Tax=Sporosarcina thermotolerans TaxID=633404 RepID=UPI0024BC2591|nr:hypothetical protein [Sporosarcina thermotolerans]WHT47699.1 hypothetical protein QNH10_16460 [Sporosarcina thermotolerans]
MVYNDTKGIIQLSWKGNSKLLNNFRLKLTIILIVFSLIISIIIAVFDYTKLRKTIMTAQETQISMAEDKIIGNLSTIDKIYELFDEQTSEVMQANTMELLERYEDNPDFRNWDFEMLKEEFEMDVFILDHTNTIIHSSFVEDVGTNFEECCPRFSNLLDERRQCTLFTTDGMDIQSRTGEVKKFSYMPTPDNKYLIELGFLLEDQDIFNQFNFLDTIDELVKENDTINSITVYNSGGTPIGVKTENFEQRFIQSPHKEVFEKVRGSAKPDELVLHEDGGRVTYIHPLFGR